MAIYMYDEDEDVAYVLLAQIDPEIERTIQLSADLFVDLDSDEQVVGVEIRRLSEGGVDLEPLEARFGVRLDLPFAFETEQPLAPAVPLRALR